MLQGDAHFTAPELAICFAPAAAPGVAECAVYPPSEETRMIPFDLSRHLN